MDRRWTEVSAETLIENRLFSLRAHRRRSPRDGVEHTFWALDSVDWVNVVALTDDGMIVLIEQFRHGTSEVTLEIPGGMVDPGETPEQAALRELREETGYAPAHVRKLGRVDPNPAIQSNRCHTFLATGCRRVSTPAFDHTEDCTLRLEPAKRASDLVRTGEIAHALVLSALAYAWLDGALPLA